MKMLRLRCGFFILFPNYRGVDLAAPTEGLMTNNSVKANTRAR